MDLLSRIADWLGENEATLSAGVGIALLAGAGNRRASSWGYWIVKVAVV